MRFKKTVIPFKWSSKQDCLYPGSWLLFNPFDRMIVLLFKGIFLMVQFAVCGALPYASHRGCERRAAYVLVNLHLIAFSDFYLMFCNFIEHHILLLLNIFEKQIITCTLNRLKSSKECKEDYYWHEVVAILIVKELSCAKGRERNNAFLLISFELGLRNPG